MRDGFKGNLTVDLDAKTANAGAPRPDLSRKEFEMMQLLVMYKSGLTL